MLFHSLLFLLSGFLLIWSSNWLVTSVVQIARYLRWKEFVIAFFVMAIVSSFPNLFVGVIAALQGIPELSFGDIVGNGVVDFTLVTAIAVFVSKRLEAKDRIIQQSLYFTIFVAVFPLLLILDGELGRADALILLSTFALYCLWLISQRGEYTKKVFNHANSATQRTPFERFRLFIKNIGKIFAAMALLIASAYGVVDTIQFFVAEFHVPVVTVGILILGLGSALPELYFSIAAARQGNSKIILGDLMGSVIVLATLVLGVVALIEPIRIVDFSPFAAARFFLVLCALFFLLFLRTNHSINRKEAIVLFLLYIAFVVSEILFRSGTFSL